MLSNVHNVVDKINILWLFCATIFEHYSHYQEPSGVCVVARILPAILSEVGSLK